MGYCRIINREPTVEYPAAAEHDAIIAASARLEALVARPLERECLMRGESTDVRVAKIAFR